MNKKKLAFLILWLLLFFLCAYFLYNGYTLLIEYRDRRQGIIQLVCGLCLVISILSVAYLSEKPLSSWKEKAMIAFSDLCLFESILVFFGRYQDTGVLLLIIITAFIVSVLVSFLIIRHFNKADKI